MRARRDSNPRQPDFFRNPNAKSPVLYLAELRAHISELACIAVYLMVSQFSVLRSTMRSSIVLRKHINCRVGNFSMRPDSIEFQWNSKLLKHKIRSSMGDCHSFDPGSNPGPGASLFCNLIRIGSDAK